VRLLRSARSRPNHGSSQSVNDSIRRAHRLFQRSDPWRRCLVWSRSTAPSTPTARPDPCPRPNSTMSRTDSRHLRTGSCRFPTFSNWRWSRSRRPTPHRAWSSHRRHQVRRPGRLHVRRTPRTPCQPCVESSPSRSSWSPHLTRQVFVEGLWHRTHVTVRIQEASHSWSDRAGRNAMRRRSLLKLNAFECPAGLAMSRTPAARCPICNILRKCSICR
jgi:hypothetical protein